MNQEQIGKFISKERKNKKLTQKDLADKLNISEKTISKWECGKGLPEVSLMQPLCQELDITVNELLNGAKDQDEDIAIIDYVKYERKKSNKKIILLTILAVLLITFILLTVIYFFNNYGKTTIYKLYGESENFDYTNTLLTLSTDKNILVSGELIPKNIENIDSNDITSIKIKSNNQIIIGGLNGIIIEDNGYNEIFTIEKLENLDNWYLEITYDINGQEKTEILKIKKDLIINSNKFFSKKNPPIGNNSQTSSNITQENTAREAEILEKKLLKEKFCSTENSIYEKEIEGYTIRVNAKTNYVRIYKKEAAYGEDSLDIKYNCERCGNNFIELESSSEGKSFYVLYDISTESLYCPNDNCPSDAWQLCKTFYDYVTKLLTIE